MDVASCLDVVMDRHAELLQTVKIAIKHGLWESEFGDGSTDHATGIAMHFEDFDCAASQRQFRCCSHAAGTGADDGYF